MADPPKIFRVHVKSCTRNPRAFENIRVQNLQKLSQPRAHREVRVHLDFVWMKMMLKWPQNGLKLIENLKISQTPAVFTSLRSLRIFQRTGIHIFIGSACTENLKNGMSIISRAQPFFPSALRNF